MKGRIAIIAAPAALLGLSLSGCSSADSAPKPEWEQRQALAQEVADRINAEYSNLSAEVIDWTEGSWKSAGDVVERSDLSVTRVGEPYNATTGFVVDGSDELRLPSVCAEEGVCPAGIAPKTYPPMTLEELNAKGWL